LRRNEIIRIYNTTILPVVLCGCEIWFLTLRYESRLRVFENRVLRRIFGLKRDEVIGGCRWLQASRQVCYYKLNWNNKVKEHKIDRTCSTNEKRNACRTLKLKSETKRQLRRLRNG
jgi:hypothetical protein